MPSRRHVHTRSIRAEVFARDDGLWDVEAELVDTKKRDFQLATGLRLAETPIHHMRIVLTIDTTMDVVDVDARTLAMPYPGHCATIEPDYRKLIGLNLLKGFRHGVREKLGSERGCTHLTELTDVMPTAAVQAFAGEIFRDRDGADDDIDAGNSVKPFQLDRCHALRTDGPAVARYYPRWFRPAETVAPSAPTPTTVPSRPAATTVASRPAATAVPPPSTATTVPSPPAATAVLSPSAATAARSHAGVTAVPSRSPAAVQSNLETDHTDRQP